MITIRKAQDRGHFDHGWLDTYHSFSFADYHDPKFMGFSVLRVINEDRVAPGRGFGTHPHRDMEILTYILSGALEHKDSMGTGSVIKPGDVQRMSAGSGVTHSEFNASKSEEVHLLQIWVLPHTRGEKPSYEQKHFAEGARRDQLALLASPDGRLGSVSWNQDVALYGSVVSAGKTLDHALVPGRCAWLQLAKGQLQINGHDLRAGDGAAITTEPNLSIKSGSEAEFLLFDLPE